MRTSSARPVINRGGPTTAGNSFRLPTRGHQLGKGTTIIDTFHLPSPADYVTRALRLIKPGEIITLDESTQSMELASHLTRADNLTVLTNGLIAARLLTSSPGITVVLVPGQLDRRSNSVTTPLLYSLPYRSDHAFFGATSYTPGVGLMERTSDLARTKNLLHRSSIRSLVTITADALNRFGPYVFATADDISSLHIISQHQIAAPDMTREPNEAGKMTPGFWKTQ